MDPTLFPTDLLLNSSNAIYTILSIIVATGLAVNPIVFALNRMRLNEINERLEGINNKHPQLRSSLFQPQCVSKCFK